METQTARHTHPLLIVAAIAITLFSLVGIGAVLGWIPTSVGNPSPASTPLAQAPEQPVAQPEPAKRVEEKPAVRPRPKPVARSEAPVPIPRAGGGGGTGRGRDLPRVRGDRGSARSRE